jgi:hypothetical protein
MPAKDQPKVSTIHLEGGVRPSVTKFAVVEPVSSGIPKKGDDGSRENSFAGQESQMSRDDDDNVSNNEGNASIGDGGSSYGGETAAKQDDGTSTSTAW